MVRGGGVFLSGRNKEFIEGLQNTKKSIDKCQYIKFLDADNFTAQYRQGNWFFQHFHTRETLEKTLSMVGLKIVKFDDKDSSWRCICERVRELTIEEKIAGIDFEFNLPLPNNKRYNRQEDVKNTLKKIGAL